MRNVRLKPGRGYDDWLRTGSTGDEDDDEPRCPDCDERECKCDPPPSWDELRGVL